MKKLVTIGLLGLGGLVLLGTVWLQSSPTNLGSHRVSVQFADVTGLMRGGDVLAKGVKVGKVLRIDLIDGAPLVEVGLRHPSVSPLPRDSKMFIRQTGRWGETVVQIEPGSSQEVFQKGDTLQAATDAREGSR